MIASFRHILTDTAIEDLADIHGYVAERDPAAAGRLIAAITTKIVGLAASGNSGAPRNDILPGLRAFPFKQRCIYFRIVGRDFIVVRVLHGRRDITPGLFKE